MSIRVGGGGGSSVTLPIAESDVTNLLADLASKATPAQITAAIDALKGGVSTAYDTLVEIVTQLGSDESVVAALITTVAGKAQALTATDRAASFNFAAGELALIDTTSGAVVGTLPTTPADKTRCVGKWTAGANAASVAAGGSAHFNTTAGGTTFSFPLLNESVQFQYRASNDTWTVTANDLPLSGLLALLAPIRSVSTVAYAATVTPAVGTSGADIVLNIGALTGNLTLVNPTGTPADGQNLRVRLQQDGTGGRTITFGSAFAFGTDVTTALVPTGASAKWTMLFSWNASDSKWRAMAIARGF